MSPRHQTISDSAILQGAARAISRLGVMRITLADVAAELDISAGTLVHRFGSKRGLLLALLHESVGRVPERFANLRTTHRSPYATLLTIGGLMARYVQTPEALANHLAFLQVDLSDPEVRRLTTIQSRAVRREIRSLIRDAIEAGEVVRCDADRVARAVQATMSGSLLQWAIEPRGKLASWIRGNLATVLGSLATARGRRVERRQP